LSFEQHATKPVRCVFCEVITCYSNMKRMKFRNLAFTFFLMALAGTMPAQVVVNEYSAANYSDWAQGGGWSSIYEDWLEFYNPSGSAVNISGYWLSDDVANPMKWEIPAGTSVPANGYFTLLLSGTGEYDAAYLGYVNTNFKVTQTAGEDIVFSDTDGSILESYDFATTGPNQANHSFGRETNGGANWVIFTNPSNNASNSGPSGTGYAPLPVMDMQAGYYGSPISVEISSPEAGADIYYTLDGTAPTSGSTLYTGPVNISTSTPLRAIAYSPDPALLASFIETNTYFFGDDQHTIPFVSITGPTLSDGSWGGNEMTDIEFFTPDGTFVTEAHGDSNEHGNDSNAYDQRGFDYITRDALGYDNVVDLEIFNSSDRDKFERLIFKAAANDNYPFSGGAHIRDAYVHELGILGGLHTDSRKTESYIVYINADYWGVYDAREKVDDIDFTDYYFQQPEGFVDFIKTWGGTWYEYGDGADWYDLVDFITTNDMADAANYDYVLTQYNTLSLIDYFILNSYCVTTDWLNWNTAWWRGRHPDGDAKRWRYALWDNDATFGHYVNYTGVPDTSPQADPCDPDGLGDVGGQGHVPVLNALFDNDDFFADYIQRYAALSNTVFSCDQMIGILDSMITVIAPEMQDQVDRWGGSVAGWEANVQTMRDFIEERCADEIIGGLEDCYDVTAYTLTVLIEGVGLIEINTVQMDQNDVPWSGIFFGGLPIDLAIPGSECGSFAGWEIISGDGTLDNPNSPDAILTMNGDVTLQATFVAATEEVIVVTDVFPAGAGEIVINGIDQATYPQTSTFGLGGFQTLSVTENEWFTFDYWESQSTDFNPNAQSTSVGFTSCVADTITAVFIETPHFTLTVDVEPAGAGSITMNGDPLASYPFTDVLEGAINYNFVTVPTDQWNVFDHWEINHHVLNPDEFNTNIFFTLSATDTLIAVYNVIVHYAYTVVVNPPFSGTVIFDDTISTQNEITVELGVNEPVEFLAIPNEYWDFVKWDSHNHIPSPSWVDKMVSYEFTTSDTIIANFAQDPFSIYVPNSFSPNNDGVNDYFIPVGNALDVEEYSLKVFSRWGDKVFETTDVAKGWDGSHTGNGYYNRDDIYVFFLKVKSVHESEYEEITGHITVFR